MIITIHRGYNVVYRDGVYSWNKGSFTNLADCLDHIDREGVR